MFSSIFNPCTIKLHILQNVLFMSPPTDSTSVPADDPLIRGVLEIHCPSDRVISGIEIKLKALQSVALIDSGMHTGTEDSIVFEKTVQLGLDAPESCGSHSNQTRSPSPTNRSSNDIISSPVNGRISLEGQDTSPQTSRPSSLRRKSTADSDPNAGIFLSKGVHGFEFSILLPSSSTPYERSTYGRVIWILSATAFGAGRAKVNITTERPIYPVVNPNIDGGPVILSTGYHDLSSTVGLLAADFSSDNLCVGGALQIDIRSPEPKKGIKIHLVKVSIESSIQLETKKQGIVQIPKRQKVLFIKGYVPPQTAKDAGQGRKEDGIIYDDSVGDSDGKKEWSVGPSIVRLPDDNNIRPTTLDGSMAAIRWSHNLLMQIVYSFPDSEESPGLKVFSVRNKITVPSCCASHDAVRLPRYERSAPSPSIPLNSVDQSTTAPPPLLPDSPWAIGSTVLWGPRHHYCVCGQSLASLESSIIPRRTNAVDSIDQSKIQDCSCPDSPNYTPSNPTNGYPYPSPPDSVTSASNHTSIPTRRTSSSMLSSPSRTRSVDESLGIPSLDLEDSTSSSNTTQRSRSLGYDQRQRSVELVGDPPTYACAMELREGTCREG